jgi:ADP-heptose:LPS heptosyltransferase
MTMLTDEQKSWLEAGIAKFDSGRFWDAHEEWEDLWKSLKAQDYDILYVKGIQGLIQSAALLFQVEKQNRRGVVNMWGKLTDKLGLPGNPKMVDLWGIEVEPLLTALQPFYLDAASDQPLWELVASDVNIANLS